MNINEQRIGGRIGSDAELRYTKGGSPVCSFSVATHRPKGKDRELVTTWHRVSGYGDFWVGLAPKLKKGATVYIEGETEKNKYTDKAGVERESVTVIARFCYLVEDNRRVKPETEQTDAEIQNKYKKQSKAPDPFDESDWSNV